MTQHARQRCATWTVSSLTVRVSHACKRLICVVVQFGMLLLWMCEDRCDQLRRRPNTTMSSILTSRWNEQSAAVSANGLYVTAPRWLHCSVAAAAVYYWCGPKIITTRCSHVDSAIKRNGRPVVTDTSTPCVGHATVSISEDLRLLAWRARRVCLRITLIRVLRISKWQKVLRNIII